ncbi:smg-9, nonsense mediated mRNA decay factor [Terramyces sp. JEL0728]|nr:smg-9, nonsense mediated mRNA decay factor [Terramyces sp. JEL0728]
MSKENEHNLNTSNSGNTRKLWVDEAREPERKRETKRRGDGERRREDSDKRTDGRSDFEGRDPSERKLWTDDKREQFKKDRDGRTRALWIGDKENRKAKHSTREEKDWDILLFNMFPTNAHKRPQPIKLLDQQFKFTDSAPKLLSESAGSFVVGVLGRKGVGKSTIISSLSNFKKQKASSNWIDLLRLPEGIMLLDSPPILHSKDNTQSAKTALFMLSVCHIVILVAEKHDLPMLNFIKRVNDLKTSLNQQGSKKQDLFTKSQFEPHLVYVVNKQDVTLSLYNNIKTDYQQIFESTSIITQNSIPKQSLIATLEQDETYDFNQEQILFHNVESSSSISEIVLEDIKEEEVTKTPNLFLLPDKNDHGWICERFETALQNFTNQIKGFPRMTTFGSRTSFNISEKEWFQIATGIHEKITLFEMTWPKAFEISEE